jgi:hypothetical protein
MVGAESDNVVVVVVRNDENGDDDGVNNGVGWTKVKAWHEPVKEVAAIHKESRKRWAATDILRCR